MKLLILLLVVVFGTSCNLYKEVEVGMVQDIRVNQFSVEYIDAEIDVEIDNPNWYKVKLLSSDLDLYLNGNQMGNIQLNEQIIIPKKSKGVQTIPVLSDMSENKDNFLSNVLGLLFQKTAILEVKGDVKARGFIIGKTVPVDLKEEIDATKLSPNSP